MDEILRENLTGNEGYIWSVNNRNHLSKTFDTENYISLTYVN